MTKYAAFDLEITKQITGDFSQWKNHRPLGISCAGLLFEGQEPRLWYSKNQTSEIQSQMNKTDLLDLLKTMSDAIQQGWTIVSWNGLGFDFDVLAEESGEWELCRELALNHIDMMFHFFCLQGYPLGLDKAASGLGLSGKLEGVSGEDAPKFWAQGEYQRVLDYLAQDVRTTLDVAKTVDQLGTISWISRRGAMQQVRFPSGWLPANAAMELPLPDTSWMSNPIFREGFYQWTTSNTY